MAGTVFIGASIRPNTAIKTTLLLWCGWTSTLLFMALYIIKNTRLLYCMSL